MDELTEKARRGAAEGVKATFDKAVTVAIRNISEVSQVANARIQADCHIATARIASSAEVSATELAANAEIAILAIQKDEIKTANNGKIGKSIILETGRKVEEDISTGAKKAIEAIHLQAKMAVEQITGNSKQSILEIQALAGEVAELVVENARIAREKLDEAKHAPRTPASVALAAADATEKVKNHSVAATEKLNKKVSGVIEEITKLVTNNLANLTRTVSDAEVRILGARDAALARIRDFLEQSD
jgi:flagellar motor switch/type III secretory pathway protein FliN